jgi:alkyl sulfatase BDS1-like metallo-beta-lactamase superfamily hydrolase
MAGLIPVHTHRALAWMLLSGQAGEHMLTIGRKVKRVLAVAPYRRVEITVAADFIDGQRFALLVGATLETPKPMRAYGPDGNDEYMYAIVRE